MIYWCITVTVLFILSVIYSFYLFGKLNNYISSLEERVENKIQEQITVTENLKQTFRDVLVDYTFLLDDGKIKPPMIQKEKNVIINGSNITEQTVSF